MVPEFVSADEAVFVQRGRLFDAEFHSNARDDDFRIDSRAMVAGGGAEDSVSEIATGGSCGAGGGGAATCGRDLSGGEADLDAELDIV